MIASMAGKTDSITHTTRQYRLNDTYTGLIDIPLDTLINTFHRHKRTENISPFFQGLGNYGLPYIEMDYFKRSLDPEKFIYRHLQYYMHNADNKLFIDTQVPFTELKWTFGGERQLAEQTLGVRHSQNVNRYFNVGLDLNIIYSLGQYIYQKSDNRAFTFHASYLGDKYKAFASWSLNNLKAYENGGVADPSVLDQFDTRDVPVNLGGLNEAQSRVKDMNFQVVQKYTLGADNENKSDSTEKKGGVKGTFSHILEYMKGSHAYIDNSAGTGFYDSLYINNSTTYDSLYSRILKNTLRFDFNTSEEARFQLGIGVGVVNELNVFAQIIPTFEEETPADSAQWTGNSNAVVGTVFNQIGEKFGWRADGKLYFTGLRAGDFEVKGDIVTKLNEGVKTSEIKAHGKVLNTGPSWWMNNWGSNHFLWSNDFGSEFRISVGGSFSIPGRRFNASIDYALVSNMFYFNSKAEPDQHDGTVSVITARLNKDFSFWKLRFDNSLLFQQSSNSDILDLPLVCARSAFYFDHVFNFKITGGKLQTQIGFEAEYNTPYYSYSYMPATGVFYNQNQVETGNYLKVNVFANLKVKRTRIFIGFDHVNYGLMGYDYFVSPNYPMNIRMLKYGLAWTFYN